MSLCSTSQHLSSSYSKPTTFQIRTGGLTVCHVSTLIPTISFTIFSKCTLSPTPSLKEKRPYWSGNHLEPPPNIPLYFTIWLQNPQRGHIKTAVFLDLTLKKFRKCKFTVILLPSRQFCVFKQHIAGNWYSWYRKHSVRNIGLEVVELIAWYWLLKFCYYIKSKISLVDSKNRIG